MEKPEDDDAEEHLEEYSENLARGEGHWGDAQESSDACAERAK